MKKIGLGLFILVCFLSFNKGAYANEYIENIESEIIELDFNVLNVLDENIYIGMDKSYIKELDMYIDEIIVDYVSTSDAYYLISDHPLKDNFIKIDINTKAIISSDIIFEVKDITYYKESVYVVGCDAGDGCIYKYNAKLELVSRHLYGGEGFEQFEKIKIINDKIYVIGLKDAISKYSPFINCGNIGEKKSFLVKLNLGCVIENTFYFNEKTNFEKVSDIHISEDYLLIINTDENDSYYQYKLDYNLGLIERFCLNDYLDADYYDIVSYTDRGLYIYLYLKNNTINYLVFSSGVIYSNYIKDLQQLYYSSLDKGVLKIITMNLDEFILTSIQEYHIIELNEKEVAYPATNYKSVNHFSIESYFEELEFEYSEDNDINLLTSGMYQASYVATRFNGEEIQINTPFKVLSYINVINEGIYPSGYKLIFTDQVYVNNEEVYMGEALKEEGEYKIYHNVENNIIEYTIYIKDNYNKDLSVNCTHSDYIINNGGIFSYTITLNQEKIVKQVIVNDKDISFSQDENIINIQFNSLDITGINNFNIQKIVFNDDSILDVNERFSVNVMKRTPLVEVEADTEGISFNITDIDEAILDIVFRYYKNGELIKIDKTYLNDFELFPSESYDDLKVVMLYELGTNEVFEVNLLNFDLFLNNKKNNEKLFNLSFDKDDDKVLAIYVDKIINNEIISKILVSDINLVNYYVSKKSNKLLYISLGITGVLILIIIGCLCYKKKK